MCGIAGILSLNRHPIDTSSIRKMTKAMAHRGPDAEGFYEDADLALGHLRLSIIDLSDAANQPFTDSSGRYILVFNGEMYNYREVKAKLPDYPFRTSSDTEVLIAAYATWGPDCLQHFRGMFAFAIWDLRTKELFLARDRMGVKPLYYYKDDKRFIFSSETRAMLETGLVERRLGREALIDYFCYQSVSAPYTMIEGVVQVDAGSWIKVRDGKMEKKVYWNVTKTADFNYADEKGVQREIRRLMLGSIERRLVSDVPVGAFLSGGIDSSAVVGLMAEAGESRPNTFTVAFEEKEYDESAYAEMIARKFNTRHTNILLKPTVFLDEVQNALDAMDSPSGDGINTYVVSKAIRKEGMTVALSGAGGDELFAGYPFFHQFLQMQKLGGLWKPMGPFRRMLAGTLFSGAGSIRKEKLGRLLRLPDVSITKAYPVFRQVMSPRLLAQLTKLSAGAAPVTTIEEELASRSNLEKLPLLSQVSVAEYLGYSQQTLLKDTDQMSMANSLEVREPFFDQDLIEFVLAVPDKWKKPIYPKSLLVESLRPLLPDEIVHRKKQGFLFPWSVWLKGELRSFGERRIQAMAQRPFIKGDELLDYWRRFQAGDSRTRWSELWLFIVLEYWLEKNNVS